MFVAAYFKSCASGSPIMQAGIRTFGCSGEVDDFFFDMTGNGVSKWN